MLTFNPPSCLLHLSSIPLNSAMSPSALVYTVYTFKSQDFVFCIVIYRHVAGYVEHLVLQHKAPKSFRVPKEQNLFRSRQSLQASLANCVGTRHPHALNCREAISLSPSSHQDNTHFTGKNVFAVRFTLMILQFSQELEALAVCKLPGVYSTEGLLSDSHSPGCSKQQLFTLDE